MHVRWRGLEPPRLTAHAPQACLSANSSTSANSRAYYNRVHRVVKQGYVFYRIHTDSRISKCTTHIDSHLLDQNTIKTTTKIVLFRLTTLILLIMGFILILQIVNGDIQGVTIFALGMIPILFALWLTRHDFIELAGTVIAIALVAMFTVLATIGQGAYDIGSVVFPSILIIASLVLNRRTVIYLTGIYYSMQRMVDARCGLRTLSTHISPGIVYRAIYRHIIDIACHNGRGLCFVEHYS